MPRSAQTAHGRYRGTIDSQARRSDVVDGHAATTAACEAAPASVSLHLAGTGDGRSVDADAAARATYRVAAAGAARCDLSIENDRRRLQPDDPSAAQRGIVEQRAARSRFI